MIEQYPLCDVAMVQIAILEGVTHSFITSDEIKCEPVIEEGEQKTLKIKNTLLASKRTKDLILGHDLTCKDNVFTPDLLVSLQGGEVSRDSITQKFTQYVAPPVGALPTTAPFNFLAYIEIVDSEGPTGEYLRYTYPNCRGGFISPEFKDGEYHSAEYTIMSRPEIGMASYTIDLVTSLPII